MQKVSFVALSVLLSLQVASAAELFKCHPLNTTPRSELCVPSIGEGSNLLLSVGSALDAEPLTRDLREVYNTSGSLSVLQNFQTRAEKDLQVKKPGSTFLVANSLMGNVGKLFNNGPGFSGPNCYQTALLATGIWKETGDRYVSPEEFLFYIDQYYERVSSPEMGDIIIYEFKSSKGHAAVYLQDDLIFHKKGYIGALNYRITNINDADKVEAYEWTPRFGSGMEPALKGLNVNDRAYFRMKATLPSLGSVPAQDKIRVELIEELNKQVLLTSGHRSVGRELGFIVEEITHTLDRQFSSMKNSPSMASRFAFTKLISLRDQVFQSIEEDFFSSPYARENEVREEICVQDTPAFRSFLGKLLPVLGKEGNAANVQKAMDYFSKIDRKSCRFDSNALLRAI